jgi:hypothetical protein
MQALHTTSMLQPLMKASRFPKGTWPNTVTEQHPKQMLHMLLETASHTWMPCNLIQNDAWQGPWQIDEIHAKDVLDYTYSKWSSKSHGFADHLWRKHFDLVDRDFGDRSQHTSYDSKVVNESWSLKPTKLKTSQGILKHQPWWSLQKLCPHQRRAKMVHKCKRVSRE